MIASPLVFDVLSVFWNPLLSIAYIPRFNKTHRYCYCLIGGFGSLTFFV